MNHIIIYIRLTVLILIILINDNIMSLCIYCNKKVTSRQEALLCENCNRWQHRICKTGILRKEYLQAVKSNIDLILMSGKCKLKVPPIVSSILSSTLSTSSISSPTAINPLDNTCSINISNILPVFQSTLINSSSISSPISLNLDYSSSGSMDNIVPVSQSNLFNSSILAEQSTILVPLETESVFTTGNWGILDKESCRGGDILHCPDGYTYTRKRKDGLLFYYLLLIIYVKLFTTIYIYIYKTYLQF